LSKQYRIIKGSVSQLESKLNGAAEEGWRVTNLAALDKNSIVAVLEKSRRFEEEVLHNAMQQQSQLFQTMSSIIKSQHELGKSVIENLKA
jgi:t-SNARE complex subunit (syntaxin)